MQGHRRLCPNAQAQLATAHSLLSPGTPWQTLRQAAQTEDLLIPQRLKVFKLGAGEIVHQLRALTAPAELEFGCQHPHGGSQ